LFDAHQGRVEYRLPFLDILVPKQWSMKHEPEMRNLQRASKSMATFPFDVYETLRALIEHDPLMSQEARLGASLFKVPDYARRGAFPDRCLDSPALEAKIRGSKSK
jgi:hypothetical protein